MNKFIFWIIIFLLPVTCIAQPWQSGLNIVYSNDGSTFNAPVLFQDSSGVPSAVHWKSDTCVCVFQWFRQPINSPTWDRVAVKFSYDNGITWTQPVPIVVNGIPSTFQRPFDPALTVLSSGELRIYYSSSDGIPMGNDSIINTYSALSTDGINFTFEPGARVDESSTRVIDPSIIYFNHAWHYAAPAGSPQQGAFHYISTDGLAFSKVPDIPSDVSHNWTGNYMVNDSQELRFYGCGNGPIWYNTSPNGGVWNGFINTNISGGDPTAVKISGNNYFMIFVGPNSTTSVEQTDNFRNNNSSLSFESASNTIHVLTAKNKFSVSVFSMNGALILQSVNQHKIDLSGFAKGLYYIHFMDETGKNEIHKILVE